MLPKLFTMFKFLVRISLFSALFFYFLTLGIPANAGCTDYFSCSREIERVKREIARLDGLENTLANQISYLDNQIYLSELETFWIIRKKCLLTGPAWLMLPISSPPSISSWGRRIWMMPCGGLNIFTSWKTKTLRLSAL